MTYENRILTCVVCTPSLTTEATPTVRENRLTKLDHILHAAGGVECLPRKWSFWSRYEITGPLEYHIQRFLSSLYVVTLIFKPVFVCMHSEKADESWLENERSHIQEEGNL